MKYDEYVNSNENIKDLCDEIDQLRKEKNELKTKYDELNDFNNSQVKKLLEQNAELKNQIAGLRNNIDGQKARKNHHIKENVKLTSEVAKLKAQIEKMKCCFNCKHYNFNYKEELECDLEFIYCTNHKVWELEE